VPAYGIRQTITALNKCSTALLKNLLPAYGFWRQIEALPSGRDSQKANVHAHFISWNHCKGGDGVSLDDIRSEWQKTLKSTGLYARSERYERVVSADGSISYATKAPAFAELMADSEWFEDYLQQTARSKMHTLLIQ
jgi:hypothetical protein